MGIKMKIAFLPRKLAHEYVRVFARNRESAQPNLYLMPISHVGTQSEPLRKERAQADDDEDDSAHDFCPRTKVSTELAANQKHGDTADKRHDANRAAVKDDICSAGSKGHTDDEGIDRSGDGLEENRRVRQARRGALLGLAKLPYCLDDHLAAHERKDHKGDDTRIRLNKWGYERASKESSDGHGHLKQGEHDSHKEFDSVTAIASIARATPKTSASTRLAKSNVPKTSSPMLTERNKFVIVWSTPLGGN